MWVVYGVSIETQEMQMTYLVTASLKNPGCYHSGYEVEVQANTRKEAIKEGRRLANRECAFSREDGPKKWDAKKI